MVTCGCVLPVSRSCIEFIPLKPLIQNSYLDKSTFLCSFEEDYTVKFFLDALTRYDFEVAKAYISKNFITHFDLDELSEYFCKTNNYKFLVKAEFKKPPKNCKINSIMVVEDRPGNKMSIIHLHMVKEPDTFGKWKIYSIDKE